MALTTTHWQRWLVQSLTTKTRWRDYFEPLIQLWQSGYIAGAYRTQVVAVEQTLPQVTSLLLRPPKHWPGFRAGQHVQLAVEHQGVRRWRTFSIASAPQQWQRQGLIQLTIREQPSGQVTPQLKHWLSVGTWVGLSAATGEFALPANGPVLMIAGGLGITPFRAMLQQLASEGSEREIILMQYSRDRQQQLFAGEWSELALRLPNWQYLNLTDDHDGHFHQDHLTRLKHQPTLAMICGPGPMMQQVERVLSCWQPDLPVLKEVFGVAPTSVPARAGDIHLSFTRSAHTTQVAVDDGRSLLQLAEGQGLTPSYGCRRGVCHQCLCHKPWGRVRNLLTGEISDSGAQDIQLCISAPVDSLALEL